MYNQPSTSSFSYSSSFVIPRKNTSVREQAASLCSDVKLDSREFQKNIRSHFISSLLNVQSKDGLEFKKCTRINNSKLLNRLDTYRKSLKENGYSDWQIQYSFAYLEINDDITEINRIANEGLEIGNSIDSDLGDCRQGIYICKHSDLTTPSPPVTNCPNTILVCKVLRGKCKSVGLESIELEPDFSHNCHAANLGPTLNNSRIEAYRRNRIYFYELNEFMEGEKRPASICPLAVVTCQFPTESGKPLHLPNRMIWRGRLSVGHLDFAVAMNSNFSLLKIHALGRKLTVDQLVPWQSCLDYSPIKELIHFDQPPGALFKRKEVILEWAQNAGLMASYWTVSIASDKNAPYTKLYADMRKTRTAAISSLPGGTNLLLFPNGELAQMLCLPPKSLQNNGDILHCLVISYRSVVYGLGFSMANIYDKRELIYQNPSLNEAVDGLRDTTVALFKAGFYSSQATQPSPKTSGQTSLALTLASTEMLGPREQEIIGTSAVKMPSLRGGILKKDPRTLAARDPRMRRFENVRKNDEEILAQKDPCDNILAASISTPKHSDYANRVEDVNQNVPVDDAMEYDPAGAQFSPQSNDTTTPNEEDDYMAEPNEKAPDTLFSENAGLVLQLDEALNELSSTLAKKSLRISPSQHNQKRPIVGPMPGPPQISLKIAKIQKHQQQPVKDQQEIPVLSHQNVTPSSTTSTINSTDKTDDKSVLSSPVKKPPQPIEQTSDSKRPLTISDSRREEMNQFLKQLNRITTDGNESNSSIERKDQICAAKNSKSQINTTTTTTTTTTTANIETTNDVIIVKNEDKMTTSAESEVIISSSPTVMETPESPPPASVASEEQQCFVSRPIIISIGNDFLADIDEREQNRDESTNVSRPSRESGLQISTTNRISEQLAAFSAHDVDERRIEAVQKWGPNFADPKNEQKSTTKNSPKTDIFPWRKPLTGGTWAPLLARDDKTKIISDEVEEPKNHNITTVPSVAEAAKTDAFEAKITTSLMDGKAVAEDRDERITTDDDDVKMSEEIWDEKLEKLEKSPNIITTTTTTVTSAGIDERGQEAILQCKTEQEGPKDKDDRVEDRDFRGELEPIVVEKTHQENPSPPEIVDLMEGEINEGEISSNSSAGGNSNSGPSRGSYPTNWC